MRTFGEGIATSVVTPPGVGREKAVVDYFLRILGQWIDGLKQGKEPHEMLSNYEVGVNAF